MGTDKADNPDQRVPSMVVVIDRGQTVTERTQDRSIEFGAERMGLGDARLRTLNRLGGLPANSFRVGNVVRVRAPNGVHSPPPGLR